ncbi:MAG: hypothetical protein ACRC6M_06985 [Microcystaceae cyanobacterium]
MPTVTETELKELKDLITTGFSRLDNEITDLKVSVGKIEATLQAQQPNLQKIPDLAEKVGELKNWKQIGLIIATAMISSIFSGTIGGTIGWLIKSSSIRP